MCFLESKFSWLAAPLLWASGIFVLVVAWAAASPAWIMAHFDQDGASPVEVATVGFFFFQIGFMWLVPPMPPSGKRTFLLADFSLITFFAICRELDWHKLLIKASNLPGATHGTPFKLKFLTNPANPLSDRIMIATCFVVAFGLCGATLFCFLPRLIKGLFKLHPVCWSIGFLGGTTALSQIADRLPATLRHSHGIHLTESQHALSAALEEGQELLLPLFVILAILQAHFIYNNAPSDSDALAKHREL